MTTTALRSPVGTALIAATVLSSMVGFLDANVVNVAVPAIGADLGAGVVALQWTLTGHLLTVASLLLLSGALAPSPGALIAARVAPGAGAALVVPTSLAVLNGTLRREDRARAMTTVLFYGALAAAGYLLVIQCQLVLGYPAAQAGAVSIPNSILFLALSPVSGSLVSRFGPRWLMTAGIVATGAGFVWVSAAGAVDDADLGEASAVNDAASRIGGAVTIACVPLLIGAGGGDLAAALVDGFRPAMLVLAGLCGLAALVTADFVSDRKPAAEVPKLAPPAPHRGCAVPATT
ncbi:hypothetical protein ACQP2F_21495 [Actinoplanes sp. CA-030573]|uniref:hypothetical protein n=1 Tax=Actinoplanes sp. CA-030573 TaxID=3239898 RepID=UPI003D89C916